jgi:hypothetical protein
METLREFAPHLSAAGAVLGCIALILSIATRARLRSMARPFEELLLQADANETSLLHAQILAVERNQHRIEEILAYTRHLRTQAMNAMQGIGFLRYDAFEDIRGQQSFSVCLLNAHLDGVLITSIAGRTDSRTYAKPVHQGRCEAAMSEEESRAIALAKESLSDVHEPVLAGV